MLSAWFDATISPYPLVRPLLVAVLGAAVLTVVAGLASRSARIGGLIATAIIWVLWSRNLLDLAETAINRLGVAGIAFALAIVLVIILVARILRRGIARWTVEGATSFLNRGALLLLLVTVVMGVATGAVGRAIADLDQGQDLESWLASPGADGGREGPDVYAVLLDGYPRADVLDRCVRHRQRTVRRRARGARVRGLPREPLGLHLDAHLGAVPAAHGLRRAHPGARAGRGRSARRSSRRFASVIDHNPAFAFAREHGYTTVSVGSGFEQVTARKTDVFVDSGDMNEFEVSLLASTFLGDIVNLVAPTFAASQQAARIEHNLDTLPTIAGAGERRRCSCGPTSRRHISRPCSPRMVRSSRCRSPTRSTGTRRWSAGRIRPSFASDIGRSWLPQRSDRRDGRRHPPPIC